MDELYDGMDSMTNIKNVYDSSLFKELPFYCFSCWVVHVLTSCVEQDYPLKLTDGHIHCIGILPLCVLHSGV